VFGFLHEIWRTLFLTHLDLKLYIGFGFEWQTDIVHNNYAAPETITRI
jgi:hypothetical protein